MVKLNELMGKFHDELESAHDETESKTKKRLEEEALRIKSERKHGQELRKEREYHAIKIKKEQSKLVEERSGQTVVIDHLYEQWKEEMAATKMKIEVTKAKETAKWMNKI